MNILVVFALLFITVGCQRGVLTTTVECTPESRQERAAFIINCSEAANPKSDEEGEDLVAQCEDTSEKLFCKQVPGAYIAEGDWTVVPCSEVKDSFRKTACSGL